MRRLGLIEWFSRESGLALWHANLFERLVGMNNETTYKSFTIVQGSEAGYDKIHSLPAWSECCLRETNEDLTPVSQDSVCAFFKKCIAVKCKQHQLKKSNQFKEKGGRFDYRKLDKWTQNQLRNSSVCDLKKDSMTDQMHSRQQELIKAHTRQADSEDELRKAKFRVSELDMANKRLLEHETLEDVAGLQEELISVKVREAESSLALEDVPQRLAELEQHRATNVHDRAFVPSSASLEKDSTSEAHTSYQQTAPLLTSARAGLVVNDDHGIRVARRPRHESLLMTERREQGAVANNCLETV
ncbi:hypothetical protein CAEBREN_14051 [Caenorhabditis brenneri]|uniref:Uncharacterized protein n=1 Tax=Caenorhabditis brenneri TaxID=135651 RepID=G0P2T7_CAEBE|nr:hypothetical protein CAEBREN_14051 [Caenorhabditis brenneri]